MKICHIIGAGEVCPDDIKELRNIQKNDFIIAADGGFNFLTQNNIIPDLLIGDFDSYNLQSPLPPNLLIKKLNPEKDYTDMHTAIQYGIDKGYSNFRLYGATGGRIDHTFANIQLLAWLTSINCTARILGIDNIFDVITNDSIHFSENKSGYISVFSLSEKSIGVSETGLKYELNNATLTNTFPLGVSNEFISIPSTISVECGTLLIISPR